MSNTIFQSLSKFKNHLSPTTAPNFDGKANLLTNGQIIINETAFHSAFQHQQDNTPANNTPRAFLKAMFLDEQLNISDSALIRINRGANTIHTYSGQRTAQQNGYVYIYVTIESNRDIRFDDLFACPEYAEWVTRATEIKHHYPSHLKLNPTPPFQPINYLTNPLSHPFGQEITPLSSKAVLKTPNDRMLQQNEWDEEFGLDLHDFDARLYDASIGRFWGVDPVMESYMKTNPYQYAFNNPNLYADPDGRTPKLIIAVKLFAKLFAKTSKKVVSKFVLPTKKMATSTKVAWYAGAGANIYQNRHHIGNGTLAGGIFRAIGFGIAGGTGAAISMGKGIGWSLGGMAAGGMMTAGWGGLTDEEDINFWQLFSRGASSAMFGKNFGKAYASGKYANAPAELADASGSTLSVGQKLKKAGLGIAQKSIEKGAQAYFTKYGIYGEEGTKKYGKNFYWNAFFGGMIAGAFNEVAKLGSNELFSKLATKELQLFSKGIFTMANTYYTDGIKFNYLYNNSSKKYRAFLKENRGMTRFWSLSNSAALMGLFFEGTGY